MLSPSYRPLQFCLGQNLHHTGCVSSCPFPSCSVASSWSRESQVLLFCQFRSALGKSSPPRHMVGFRHRPIFAQLVPCPVVDHTHLSPHFRHFCYECLSRSLCRRYLLSSSHSHASQSGCTSVPMRHCAA